MDNDIIGVITEETKEKLRESRDFDEQEAYFLLCEIFAYAQATKDYGKFQTDLNEWKKRYPLDLFSEGYRIKIKYMLSKEFLDTVLKNFVAFDELSKKDPSQGMEKLRKILDKAEKHKNEKKLDKDLDELYKEFPLKYLKEKYPHIVNQLLSKANRTRILEKFDSGLAFKELTNITENTNNFKDANDFTVAIEEWKKLYPTADFNDKYKSEVEKTLTEISDTRKLEELFPESIELDLNLGEVIPLELQETVKHISIVSKDALHDFFKIVDKNKGNVDGLFDWICKYNKYFNTFDDTIKTSIVENLMTKYAYELPPVGTKYQIPDMETRHNDLLSLSDFSSINDTKKQVLLQFLGILSTGKELTHEDSYRIALVGTNAQKAKTIKKAKMEQKVEWFMENLNEDKLTPSDETYIRPITENKLNIEFKESIKIEEPIEPITRVSGSSGTSDTGNNGGGWSSTIALNTAEEVISPEADAPSEKEKDDVEKEEPISHEEEPSTNKFRNFFNRFRKHEDDSSERDDI